MRTRPPRRPHPLPFGRRRRRRRERTAPELRRCAGTVMSSWPPPRAPSMTEPPRRGQEGIGLGFRGGVAYLMGRRNPMRLRPLALWALPLVLALASAPGARAEAAKKPDQAPPPSTDIKVEGPQTSAGGRITVEKPLVDAGEVVRGQLATAVFEIKNTGTGVLKILSAKPG